MTEAPLVLLTLNVGSPSAKRAERQLAWLETRAEQILVLTETSPGAGTDLLAERFTAAGWELRFTRPVDGERGVMIASRIRLDRRVGDLVRYLPARAEFATAGQLGVAAVYVPSRDASPGKIERKRRFLTALATSLTSKPRRTSVVIGDLNILEPDHRPRYPFMQDWEYAAYTGLLDAGWFDAYRMCHPSGMHHSWVSADDDGFRFDHAFVTADLVDRVLACDYIDEPRETGLTDHSALTLELQMSRPASLEVGDSLSGEPPALF